MHRILTEGLSKCYGDRCEILKSWNGADFDAPKVAVESTHAVLYSSSCHDVDNRPPVFEASHFTALSRIWWDIMYVEYILNQISDFYLTHEQTTPRRAGLDARGDTITHWQAPNDADPFAQ